MLPLSLLKSATGYPLLVELKNGETYKGKLESIDLWMNLNLKEVVRTSKDGDQFWTIPEMYVRGNTIKYLRVPDVVLDVVEEEKQARETSRNRGRGKGRSRTTSRGRGGRNNNNSGGRGGRGNYNRN